MEKSGLDELELRRENVFEKFTCKTLDIPKCAHWFPQKDTLRDTRNPRPYLKPRASSDRLYRSPMFAMRRLLNDEIPVRIGTQDTYIWVFGTNSNNLQSMYSP